MYVYFVMEFPNLTFGPIIYYPEVSRGFFIPYGQIPGECLTARYDHYIPISATDSVLRILFSYATGRSSL